MGLLQKLDLKQLFWSEGIRALLCMLPVVLFGILGKAGPLVALGQGGFFYSSVFLPEKIRARLIMGSIIITLGLGFYLLGGNVVGKELLGTFITFFVALNLSFLSGWSIGGPIALTLMMIYTAGLNAGSPEKAAYNFLAFMLVMIWSMVISMLPFWKPVPPPKVDPKLNDLDYAEQGLRMGIGSAIALQVSYIFNFAMTGWAPSAVSHIVRFDPHITKLRAWARIVGTVLGAGLAVLALVFLHSTVAVVYAGALFAVLNGLFKKSKIGAMPLFYTATILLLYSVNDLSAGYVNAIERVFDNLIGIIIGVFVVIYPFPYLMKRLRISSAK